MSDLATSSQSAYGLGLGLPSTFSCSRPSSARSGRLTTFDSCMVDGDTAEYLFPIPTSSRHFSTETMRVRPELVSYWSPNSDTSEEFESDDDCDVEEAGIASCQDEEGPALQLVNVPDTCVDTQIEAKEYAWLMPLVDIPQLDDTTNIDVSRTSSSDPPVISVPSRHSSLSLDTISSIIPDLEFASLDLSPLDSPAESTASMLRSHSLVSSSSTFSVATAATSTVSVLDRKRPIAPSFSHAASSNVIKLRAPNPYRRMSTVVVEQSSTLGSTLQAKHAGLVRRDTAKSIHSMHASILCCETDSPSIEPDTIEAVLLRPMSAVFKHETVQTQNWTSHAPPAIPYGSQTSEADHQCAQVEEGKRQDDTRKILYDIWAEAEAVQSARIQAKVDVRNGRSSAEVKRKATKKVLAWADRMRKSVSSSTAVENVLHETIAPVVSAKIDASPAACAPPTLPVESKTPRRSRTSRPDQMKSRSGDPVWDFLG